MMGIVFTKQGCDCIWTMAPYTLLYTLYLEINCDSAKCPWTSLHCELHNSISTGGLWHCLRLRCLGEREQRHKSLNFRTTQELIFCMLRETWLNWNSPWGSSLALTINKSVSTAPISAPNLVPAGRSKFNSHTILVRIGLKAPYQWFVQWRFHLLQAHHHFEVAERHWL